MYENLNFENYKEACLKFAEDSKDWYGLHPNHFYSSQGNDWKESSDNADCDLGLSWAFFCDKEEIERKVQEMYRYELKDLISCYDEDEEDIKEVVKLLKSKMI